jgi:molybdopterin/thiamine biosynthesis adenylyltransferase
MNDDELLRYSRHITLPEVDIEGQEKLLAARVLIVGLGGLGSPIALYLAAAGVGTLVLADGDRVDLTNLQRQVVHRSDTVGMAKTESAAQTLRALNPGIAIECVSQCLDDAALRELVARVDLVVEGTDNLAVRYAINRACIAARVPWVSGAAVRFEGQVTSFDPRQDDSPCYACLYPAATDDAQQTCSENGVISPLVGVIGTLQALEVLKLLTGVGVSLVGHLLVFDAKESSWLKLRLPRNPKCTACGPRP